MSEEKKNGKMKFVEKKCYLIEIKFEILIGQVLLTDKIKSLK